MSRGSISVRGNHDSRVAGAPSIEAGSNYWLTIQSSGGADILVERSQNPTYCDPGSKRGAEHRSLSAPPDAAACNASYNDDCYGWSVW